MYQAPNCSYGNYVEVLEGSYGSTDVIKRLCSWDTPFDQRTIRSKGNSLLVYLHTDGVNFNRGFWALHLGEKELSQKLSCYVPGCFDFDFETCLVVKTMFPLY